MQEFNIESFNNFILRVLNDIMTDDDYTLVMEELGFPRPHGTNPIMYKTGCHNIDFSHAKNNLAYYPETRSFYCFSQCSKSYNILDLVKTRFELIGESKTTYKSMQWICQVCSIPFEFSNDEEVKVIEYDWKRDIGRYRKGKKSIDNFEIKVYNDDVLSYFPKVYHEDWVNDNISIEIMQKYEICFYPYRNAILIPCRNINGELIGIRMRLLDPNSEHKYFPLYMLNGDNYKFSTNECFYGIYQAKEAIKKHKRAVLVESEKGHLQGATYYGTEDNVIIGNYGRGFSDKKRNMLLALGITELTIAYDFDYSKVGEYDSDGEWIKIEEFLKFEESIMRTAEYFHGYCKVTALVSYGGHKLKDCATDNGKEWYEKLWKEREVIYE